MAELSDLGARDENDTIPALELQMRSLSIVAVMAALFLVSSTRSQETVTPNSKDHVDESLKKVQELRAERLEALVKVVDQYATLRKSARATVDDVWDAQRLLYEARLDSAETDEERVRAYEPLIAVLKAREAHAEEQVQAGRDIQPNALKAKARRLEAEIHLEQAKLKLAKSVK